MSNLAKGGSQASATLVRMPSKRQTLDAWIFEALNDPDKKGACRQISLVHMMGATGQREIHSVLVGEGSGKTPKILAGLFDGKAQSYAQDLIGIQTFNLLAFYGDSEEPQAYHPFSLAGEAFHPGLSTEAPNAEGITQMLMRHVEIKEKLHVQERVTIFDALLQSIDFLTKANQKLQEDNAEAFTIVKEIMLERTLNTHDLKMKEMAFMRSTGEREKLMKMAPALVNTVAGREVFPQGTSDTALIEAIAEGIDPKALETLAGSGAIPMPLLGLLASRLLQATEKKNAEAARLQQLAEEARVTTDNPEADAAGDVS